MLKRRTFIILICFTSLYCAAQNRITEAGREIGLFNYAKAIEILRGPALKSGKNATPETCLLLADCYRMVNDAANAKTWYKLALETGSMKQGAAIYAEAWYHYAQALRSCGLYPEAKQAFLKYDSLVPGKQSGRQFAGFCDSAMKWQPMNPLFTILNLKSVNSPQSEFGAVPCRQGVVFASDRGGAKAAGKTYGWTGNSYLNLYYAEPVTRDSLSGLFNDPVRSPDIPGQPWHDGPVCFNRDFTEMFINRTLMTHDKGKREDGHVRTHLLKIFTSVFNNGKWSAPEPFFLNSDEYSVGHPALSPDGATLYFVSDMKGGYGETDIWCCHRNGEKWGDPVNLGPVVNTPGKEMFPFAGDNGRLWFASDGLPGFGGLDLYETRQVNGKWLPPVNLGQPLNSSYDDFSLAMTTPEGSGMFSSNRPGGQGGDDIYYFAKKAPGKPVIPPAGTLPKIAAKPAMSIDTMVANKPYRLQNIFYDFDKWNIRQDAKQSLDQLVLLMKEHPVIIELGSHTDCRGTEEYNRVLSQRRAESAVKYIVSQGISPSRITARGYGESQPANNCRCDTGVQCSEAEHQFNRRTEFRITGSTALPPP